MVCLLGVNMHIYLKDVDTEYFPTHQSERNNLLSTCLHIYLNDVYSGSFLAHLS